MMRCAKRATYLAIFDAQTKWQMRRTNQPLSEGHRALHVTQQTSLPLSGGLHVTTPHQATGRQWLRIGNFHLQPLAAPQVLGKSQSLLLGPRKGIWEHRGQEKILKYLHFLGWPRTTLGCSPPLDARQLKSSVEKFLSRGVSEPRYP